MVMVKRRGEEGKRREKKDQGICPVNAAAPRVPVVLSWGRSRAQPGAVSSRTSGKRSEGHRDAAAPLLPPRPAPGLLCCCCCPLRSEQPERG